MCRRREQIKKSESFKICTVLVGSVLYYGIDNEWTSKWRTQVADFMLFWLITLMGVLNKLEPVEDVTGMFRIDLGSFAEGGGC